MMAQLERWQSCLCVFETTTVASRHLTVCCCKFLGVGLKPAGLVGRSLFSQTKSAKQIWQQSGLINLGSAGPWSGTHSRLTVQGLESPGAHQLRLRLLEDPNCCGTGAV